MPGQRRNIESQLEKLPESFSVEEIKQMYQDLNTDVNNFQHIPQKKMEALLHDKHKILAYSYPSLFFKTVRREMDTEIFETMMNIKAKLDTGEIDSKRAKELVIDGARRQVDKNQPRKPKPTGGQELQVQEITLKCQVEED